MEIKSKYAPPVFEIELSKDDQQLVEYFCDKVSYNSDIYGPTLAVFLKDDPHGRRLAKMFMEMLYNFKTKFKAAK